MRRNRVERSQCGVAHNALLHVDVVALLQLGPLVLIKIANHLTTAVVMEHRRAGSFDARRVVRELEKVRRTRRREVVKGKERDTAIRYRERILPPPQITNDTSTDSHPLGSRPGKLHQRAK